jgi:uncharacterized coiled-coil protein SlyX
MKPKIKTILTGILIGVISFPTISLGGTFVSSLIQGKTAEEAVQILAEQIDSLIGRMGVVEIKQAEQGQTVSELQNLIDQQKETIDQLELQQQTAQAQITRDRWCNKMEILSRRVVAGREVSIQEGVNYYDQYPPTAEGVLEETQTQYQLWLQAKEECEDRSEE